MTLLAACTVLTLYAQKKGDLNNDGSIDIADVNGVINVMLGKAGMTPIADVNGDGQVDIADINIIINVMLGKATIEDDTDKVDTGVYLGIMGFNDHLTTKPISMLNNLTRSECISFINGLTMKNGTLLYWATENALQSLKLAPEPENLKNVVLVTFTDGLDQGSLMMNPTYLYDVDYLDALHNQIQGKIKGLDIDSYTIGLPGYDVYDITMFRRNLTQLANEPDNAAEVDNIVNVGAKFSEIARMVRSESRTQDITIKMPGLSHGTKVRFVFDDSHYIEGTFYLTDRSLRDVVYVGMKCLSGPTVYGVQDGIFVSFFFENLKDTVTYGNILPVNDLKMYYYIWSTGNWQINSEFTPTENTASTIKYNGVLVMLSLDCSSSLGSDFVRLKEKACEFVDALADVAPTLTYTVGGVSFNMLPVKGGTYTMGSASASSPADERPAHQVTVNDFALGETEVTQALWQAVMGANPSNFTGDPQRPVENVSWSQCQTFITKLNQMTGMHFRRPTEAEWEYAARGGSKSAGCTYSGSNTLDDVAWYTGNSTRATHPVAQKLPNELGLYDMTGNVWEWCQDNYGSSYYSNSPTNNPTGPTSGSYKVKRGACWQSAADDCRVSKRDNYGPNYQKNINGLRLAM